jgi:hypothetical protein
MTGATAGIAPLSGEPLKWSSVLTAGGPANGPREAQPASKAPRASVSHAPARGPRRLVSLGVSASRVIEDRRFYGFAVPRVATVVGRPWPEGDTT